MTKSQRTWSNKPFRGLDPKWDPLWQQLVTTPLYLGIAGLGPDDVPEGDWVALQRELEPMLMNEAGDDFPGPLSDWLEERGEAKLAFLVRSLADHGMAQVRVALLYVLACCDAGQRAIADLKRTL
jgi:hypothetical protein